MKKGFLLFFVLFITLVANAQVFSPKWAILETTNTVGIVKPGANDMMAYLGTKLKNLDRAAFQEINSQISFRPGSIVLVYDKIGETYLANDIEGRTLLIKGPLTIAEQKEGSAIGYAIENISAGSTSILQGTYLWIKKRDIKNGKFIIQHAGKQSLTLPAEKFYVINETTAELEPSITFKAVE